MGYKFCALVLFFVIISVDARSTQRNLDDISCTHEHPLNPYIKLFDAIPEEWRSEHDDSSEKGPLCFTRITTTETDKNNKQLNKFSSYEITFGLPKKYESLLKSQSFIQNDGQEYVNYPPFEENRKVDGITKKDVVNIRCTKTKDVEATPPPFEPETTNSPEITTANHDLDFMNDMEEICEEHLDINILDTLPSEDTTPQPVTENTRRNDDDAETIEFTTDKTTTPAIEEETTEVYTIRPEETEPSKLPRMDTTDSFTEITTELAQLITEILEDMNNITEPPSTIQHEFTVSLAPFKIQGMDLKRKEVTTEAPVTEPIRKSDDDLDAFIIQMKNIANSEPKCYLIDSKIKYGKCSKPLLPIRILTESKLPKRVKYELVENLEENIHDDEMIVSGKKNCYLLRNLTDVSECPSNHDEKTTVLEIYDLPEHPNDDPYFTISLHGRCTVVSKRVDIIECPIYQDTLPNLATENLPDHVRFKHYPGDIDVHQDDIVVHSYSHCLLLRAKVDEECKDKPDIILEAAEFPETVGDDISTSDPTLEEDSLPTYRHGQYSFEGSAEDIPSSEEESEEYEAIRHQTTPCNDDEKADSISRTTRTLPHPTTPLPIPIPIPIPDRRLTNDCPEDDVNCLTGRIKKHGKRFKSRRTLTPDITSEAPTTTQPSTTTQPPTTIKEIKIPNSRKLSKLLQTIVDESATEPMPRSLDLFKPDFVVKISCAQQISTSSCFYVSKYIMQPSFDDPHEYHMIIDKALLPPDAKIVSAPNLNIFEANETIRATSDKEKFVLIKKQETDCPDNPKDYFFILDTGSCAAERRDELPSLPVEDESRKSTKEESEKSTEEESQKSTEEELQKSTEEESQKSTEEELQKSTEDEPKEPSIVKYKKGNKIYCFDFDEDLKLHLIKCPEILLHVPVLSRPEDLKTLCRSQLKNKGHNEQMKMLRRMNIVTDYNN